MAKHIFCQVNAYILGLVIKYGVKHGLFNVSNCLKYINFLFHRCFGNTQSLSGQQRERLAMAFERKEEAIQQHQSEKLKGKKKKSPVGKFDKMEWDREAMKDEVLGYSDETLVNWSGLGRRYEIKNTSGQLAQNGGQIAFESLKS